MFWMFALNNVIHELQAKTVIDLTFYNPFEIGEKPKNKTKTEDRNGSLSSNTVKSSTVGKGIN